MVETAVTDEPFGAVADSARQIRTAIFKACEARGHKTILFTSGMPGSGSTTVVANVAAAASSVESRVLVIDANLRRPAIHKIFKLANGPGLAEVIRGEATLASSVQTTARGFDVLSAGSTRSHEYEKFNTAAMAKIFEDAKAKYDLVLIDSSPAIVAADALSLAAKVDASVLVCRAYSEKRGLVARVRNQLADSKADFLGVVVNGVRASAGGYMKANFKASMSYQNYNDAS
jgi:capsular exopolysaccharide synthesis family protein